MSLKEQIHTAMKDAMRAKEKARLGAIRLIQAEVKRIEVDERIDVDDQRLIAIMDKMVKQRRDSIAQYEAAGRAELAAVEVAEIAVIQDFLPTALTENEIDALIQQAITSTGAESMRDMGKVMGELKGKYTGQMDFGSVGAKVKGKLSS